MKNPQNPATADSFDFKRSLRLTLLIAIPVYFISVFYTGTVVPKDEEQAALAATLFVLIGLYMGRYISQIWTAKPVPSGLLVILSVISMACIVWLFVHAEFPLRDRAALNLLLFYVPLFILSIAVGMLVKLSQMTVNKQVQEANARAEQSQSELYLLQSQLSPHFLFNTLNNLYGLSLSQPDKIPTLLLKLSDLLRYSVYDTKELFVPLSEELAYITNYIEFEKIRIGERLTLTTSIENTLPADLPIAPMLLIVFVENAFKHSKNTTDQNVVIDISLKTWGQSVLFSVKNNHTINADNDTQPLEKNRGLGLVNVRKRLELLYPNAHDLTIQNQDGFYQVMLQIKVK
ncbi:sensor histidine kinase [Larkinella insperata]|uniref:Sensor histidine kinase n=1 Tax=Larkinella insperata TaxID=332158 RepID=A0ABW3QJQ3_9BACT|nr:histidine kinase [Larkinella insperata]